MGDNIWLDDRDSVRTPMQWTPDRNAGFSYADPGKLYLPVVQSLVYNYRSVNVEAQVEQPSSLLHWTRGMLAVRKRHPAFGAGGYASLNCDDESLFAYLRYTDDESITCIVNFAATARSGKVHIPGKAGYTAVDVFGGSPIGTVDDNDNLPVMLGSREFYWLALIPASD